MGFNLTFSDKSLSTLEDTAVRREELQAANRPQRPVSASQQVAEQKKPRKTRIDKCIPLKFPVSPEQRALFRQLSKRDKQSQSKYNTSLLIRMLDELRFGGAIPESVDEYNPGSQFHLTVTPNQFYKQLIEHYAIRWNVSERKAIYRIMMAVLERVR